MRIGINKFLDIFYSIMYEEGIDAVDIVDIIEVVKIMFASKEFELISSRLDLNEFTEELIMKHPYTFSFEEDGIVSFDVPDEDITKILESNKIDAGFIQQAINKRAMVKYINAKSNGLLDFKYDNPDGVYNMQCYDNGEYKAVTKLFTDGKIANNTFYKGEGIANNTRAIKVSDSTFSILLYYMDGKVSKGELRGTFYGDYNIFQYQMGEILKGATDLYDEVVKEEPKVYRFKKH